MHRRIPHPAGSWPRPTPPWWVAMYVPLLSLLPILAAVATAAGAQSPTLRDPDNAVSLTIPNGWTVPTAPHTGAILSLVAPTARGTFNLFAEAVPLDTTLDRYASDAAVRPERGPEGAVALPTTASSRTLGGEPARTAVYEASEDGVPVFLYRVVALHDSVAYTLIFATAPEEKDAYFAQARTLLDTFTFLAAMP